MVSDWQTWVGCVSILFGRFGLGGLSHPVLVQPHSLQQLNPEVIGFQCLPPAPTEPKNRPTTIIKYDKLSAAAAAQVLYRLMAPDLATAQA